MFGALCQDICDFLFLGARARHDRVVHHMSLTLGGPDQLCICLLLVQSPAEAAAVLRSIGAELVADDAGELAAGLGRLASLNCQVCAAYYAQLVAAAAAEVGLCARQHEHGRLSSECTADRAAGSVAACRGASGGGVRAVPLTLTLLHEMLATVQFLACSAGYAGGTVPVLFWQSCHQAKPRTGPRKSIDLARRAAADARRRAEQGSPGPRGGSGERPRRHSYDDGARLE